LVDKKKYIIADEETGRTSREGVYAGGDIVTGSATVISAMGAGRKAARAMHDYLMQKTPGRQRAISS
jgi:glutamate synthase (NADPH/NADH) small chain